MVSAITAENVFFAGWSFAIPASAASSGDLFWASSTPAARPAAFFREFSVRVGLVTASRPPDLAALGLWAASLAGNVAARPLTSAALPGTF